MKRTFLVLILAIIAPNGVVAQLVQLPSYRTIRIRAAGVSPNRGTALSGASSSVRAARPGQADPFTSRSFRSRQIAAHSLSVSTTLIDHQELDTAILAQASSRPQMAPIGEQQRRIDRMQRQIISEEKQRKRRNPAPTISEQTDPASEEALRLIHQGYENLSRGQKGVARIFFRTAFRHSRGSVKKLAYRRLIELKKR